MGIKGLLPLLSSIQHRVHVSTLRGRAVGVDARSWLYKAAMACPKEVAKGNTPSAFASYLKRRVELLTYAGITDLIFVFDGCECKSKQFENNERRSLREANYDSALTCEAEGDLDGAEKLYRRGIKITFEHVQVFINLLKEKQLAFLVAPYEADAQLAYFSKISAIDVVISEDSDMLVYGCSLVLFKLDGQGEGDMIHRGDLNENKDLVFSSWTDEQFKLFCCLAGCDYVESLSRVGIKTAHAIASKCRTLDAVLSIVRSNYNAAPDYCQRLTLAYYTFCHQHVFCPINNCIVPLTPLKEGVIDMEDFMGRAIPPAYLEDLIRGRLDPSALTSIVQQLQSTNMELESVSSVTDVWKLDVAGDAGEAPRKHMTTWTLGPEAAESTTHKKKEKKEVRDGKLKAPSAPSHLMNYTTYESPLVSAKLQRMKRKDPVPLNLSHGQQEHLNASPLVVNERDATDNGPYSMDDIRFHGIGSSAINEHEQNLATAVYRQHSFFDADTYNAGGGIIGAADIPSDQRFGCDARLVHNDRPIVDEQPTLSYLIDRELFFVTKSKQHRIAHLLGSDEL